MGTVRNWRFAIRSCQLQCQRRETWGQRNQSKMRPLTDEEMRALFEKLHIYIGSNVAKLIDRADEAHTFRLVKDRVYYLSEAQMKLATNIGRENLICLGTCFGKFTGSGKFRIHVTCLDYLAQYAKYKVWVKPGAEMSFLYGNNVTKAGLARITEGTYRLLTSELLNTSFSY